MSQFDPEFTGEQLRLLIVDIEGAIGSHRAGMTPLGAEIIHLCEERWRAQRAIDTAEMHAALQQVEDEVQVELKNRRG
jgi:hypothetical protein